MTALRAQVVRLLVAAAAAGFFVLLGLPLAAALLLGETLSRARLLGMVCILAGVLLVLHGGNRALVR